MPSPTPSLYEPLSLRTAKAIKGHLPSNTRPNATTVIFKFLLHPMFGDRTKFESSVFGSEDDFMKEEG